MNEEYPSIARRYLSTTIDAAIAVIVFMALIGWLHEQTGNGTFLGVAGSLAVFFLYEPLCTSKACTIGQKVMRLRVRTYANRRRLTLPTAYARFIVKLLLGFISFFSIGCSKYRRGIHDFASGSIVIESATDRLTT